MIETKVIIHTHDKMKGYNKMKEMEADGWTVESTDYTTGISHPLEAPIKITLTKLEEFK